MTRRFAAVLVLACWVALAGLPVTNAKSKKTGGAVLEQAVVESPTAPGPWLALARYYDERGEQCAAILSYCRFLTLESGSDNTKEAASRVWKLVVHNPNLTSSGMSMRPPGESDELWWQTDLLLLTLASARQKGETKPMSDAEFFATMVKGITLFVTGPEVEGRASPMWRRVGIPFFSEADNAGHLEAMAYHVTESVGSSATQDWLKVNAEAVDRFRNWSQQWKPGA
jgi:hypothetical protein